MADLTFPVLALLVFVSKIGAQVESGCVNKLVTFNAGLVHTIPSAKERKNVLKLKLQNMDADVVCLQEVTLYIIVTDMEANISIDRLPKGRGTDQWKWYCPSLDISNYCVYLHWSPDSDTHNINAQFVFVHVVSFPTFFPYFSLCYYPIRVDYSKCWNGVQLIMITKCRYRPVYISIPVSVSRNSEGHVESVQPIKCMLFILMYLYDMTDQSV